MIEQYLHKKAIDLAISVATHVLRKSGSKLATSEDQLEENPAHHLRFVKNWASEISFLELKRAKLTSDVYIPLDLFLYPRRIRLESGEKQNLISLDILFDDPEVGHTIILVGWGQSN